jgi:hypothetical protein
VRTSVVNRYYDPTTGQFVSVDPLVDLTGQPYVYAGDDPVDGSDPWGLYSYNDYWPIGQSSPTETPESIMSYFQSNLQSVFPFSTGGCNSVTLGEVCNLEFGGKINPVEVVSVTQTSFEFEALQGHIDPAGSTITFSICTENGENYLQQSANASTAAPLVNFLFPSLAYRLWSYQAENLSEATGGNYHSPFDDEKRFILGTGSALNHLTPVINPIVNGSRDAWNDLTHGIGDLF